MHKLSYAFLIGFLTTLLCLQWYQQPTYPTHILSGLFGFSGILLLTKKLLPASSLLGCLLAFLSVSQTTHIPNLHSIDSYADGSKTVLEGVVADEPDRRPLHTKYTVEVDTIEGVNGVQGKVLVSDYRNWPQYEYGDRLRIRGSLERPQVIEDFRYDNYLSRYGIYAVMYRSSISALSTKHSALQKTKRYLYSLKTQTEARLNRLYPEPHASFMAGLLTGSRKGIPEDILETFNTTGLTHIIAISGYNITIVIAVIASALFFVQPQYRLIPSVVAIVAFTIFVGASAAVIRAAIMGILGLLALHMGRTANVRLTILWTAFCMTVGNPKVLWYDAGFQLSFLAVLGLTETAPLLDPLFKKIPNTLAFRESLQLTTAAQLTAVPLIVVLFGRVSLVAPLTNAFIAPAIPLAMLFGVLSIFFGSIFAYLGWASLEWILIIAKYTSALPYASVDVQVPWWSLILYYAILAVTIYTASRFWSPKAKEQASSFSVPYLGTQTREK